MKAIPFIVTSDTNKQDILGFVLNDTKTKQSKVSFLTEGFNDKVLSDGTIKNPLGFLYTHFTNQEKLYQNGYSVITIHPNTKNSQSIELKPKSEKNIIEIYVTKKLKVLSENDIKQLIDLLGEDAAENQFFSRFIPKDFKYTKDDAINSILEKNLVCVNNPYYRKNKKAIHKAINLFLNNKLEDDVVAINMHTLSENMQRGLLNDKKIKLSKEYRKEQFTLDAILYLTK